ncbi:zinc ribbon domain-containing protein [Bacillus alkalicellulosilyticus]|uniref:zinc ribbon domain-containing protein n=1 Tax=Alkalihalobacterium alkalicellulosilyticum TaxID=1912214 RepID=UPI0009962059|nr:zinc ribbon domain-containing protein [Bacillus alkalicellulosilyticus]
MFCSKCGTKIEDNSNFCISCGSKVVSNIDSQNEIAITVHQMNNRNVESQGQEEKGSGGIFVVLGWIFFSISLLFFPIIFGPAASIMGVLARKKEKTQGTVLIVMGIVGMIVGMILGILVNVL